jgi:hypothetical protein
MRRVASREPSARFDARTHARTWYFSFRVLRCRAVYFILLHPYETCFMRRSEYFYLCYSSYFNLH